MTPTTHFDRSALRSTLDDIIDSHGLLPVMRTLLTRPLRRKTPITPLGLNDHLRRDIGLEPMPTWGDPLL